MSDNLHATRQPLLSDHDTAKSSKLRAQHDDDSALEKQFRKRRPFRNSRRVARYYSDSESESSDGPVIVQRIPKAYSHEQLIPVVAQGTDSVKDRTVRIVPFNTEVYVTTHPATSVEFGYWFPLLAQALPEQWYSYPLALPDGFGRIDFTFLSAVVEPRAVGFSVPMVTATAALQAPVPQITSASDLPLLYLSIQQSTTGLSPQDNDNNPIFFNRNRRSLSKPKTPIGPSLYRVVRAGSRDAAASQAFYQAGVNRWSTVFSCVVRHDEWMEAERGKRLVPKRFERVGETSGLLGERKDGVVSRVFY